MQAIGYVDICTRDGELIARVDVPAGWQDDANLRRDLHGDIDDQIDRIFERVTP